MGNQDKQPGYPVFCEDLTMRSNSDYLVLMALFYTDCLFKPRVGMTVRENRQTRDPANAVSIPQLRYIYRDCGIYSVSMFFGLYFLIFFILRQSK